MIDTSASKIDQIIEKGSVDAYDNNIFLNSDMITLQLLIYEPIIKYEKIDIISLYLTLKDLDEPRVEKGLEKLLS
ncbi:hypothetical protein [Vagococcus fluvialis]|uniref:hypothetical protein n=1 Tax=Vagococcus fluvialis TaxID=2738 RepID=UPI0037917CB4